MSGEDGVRPRSIRARKEDMKLLHSFLRVRDGTATVEEAMLVLASVAPENRTTSGPATGPSKEAAVVPESTAGPGQLSFDDPLPAIDPLSGRPVVIPTGVRMSPPTVDADGAPEEEGNPWFGKGGAGWKYAKKVAVPVFAKVPVEGHLREEVLRYLTVNSIPRTETAPFVATVEFDRVLRQCHVTDAEKELILGIPMRMAQSFYSNLVARPSDKGAGLDPFLP